jgi:hypothetical protein
MAITKTIVKNTTLEAVVKVYGAAGSVTIALTDLVSSNQRYLTALSISNLSGGTGYTAGFSKGVATTGGSGSGCKVNITVNSAGVITSVTINDGGSNYTVNDTLTISTGNADATFRVATISPILRANLAGAQFMGLLVSTVNVTRNSISIWDINSDDTAQFDLSGSGFMDTIQNDKDIVVTLTGTNQIYLVIRKVQGYAPAKLDEQLGPYGIE